MEWWAWLTAMAALGAAAAALAWSWRRSRNVGSATGGSVDAVRADEAGELDPPQRAAARSRTGGW